MKEVIMVHYDEIGLKGKNRNIFENKLIRNIQTKLSCYNLHKNLSIRKLYGAIVIESSGYFTDKKILRKILKTTFGISNFSFAVECENNIDQICKNTLELLCKKEFQKFRITARRQNKNFEFNSQEICVTLGDKIRLGLEKTVDLENPDLTCFVEVGDKKTYIYTKKNKSVGGLPTGVGGKVVTLLSGGIDSPVAAWYMQKRGLETVFVHFHSRPFTDESSVQKVKELAKKLTEFTPNLKLYLCPFGELQKKLLYEIPEDYRIIFYRRFMYKIACMIAKKENALAISTGESIGQVASQTIENISVIQEASELPVLRPLIGFDKQEIIKKAKEIGTFETSILPHEDCCSLFLPKHPQTKSRLEKIKTIEVKLTVELMLPEILKNSSIIEVNPC